MSTAALASLAILKVNWDRLGRDYIENFVPFVAEILRQSSEDVVSLPVLQESLRHRFGLDLPLNPLRQVLQRAVKHGFLRRQSGVFYRNPPRLNELNFAEVSGAFVAIHDRLLPRLREFARNERGSDWSDEQAATAIHGFLADQGLKLLYSQAENTAVDITGISREATYLVASFLSKARASDPQLLEDFVTLVKGQLLANAIYLPDPGRVARRFQDTRVYLDTSVLIFAAGYAGPERQAPCEELLRLLREYGADLRCFDITADEIRGILDACAARLRTGQLRNAWGPTIEWFIESGRSASDIELMIARLPEKLRSLGIAIDRKPTRTVEYQVDEPGFDAILQAKINYRNPKARVHDVDCVAAMAQIRQGRHSFEVESSRALFVTTNLGLAQITRQFFQREAPEGAVALCTTDYSLGNLLWLKNPTRAPDLPQKLLLADAYAAMQPPDALWKLYLVEIAQLQEQGSITTDEYFALRHSLTARRALMDLTAGETSAFSEGTVAEVLRVAKESLRADLLDQLEVERQKLRIAEQAAHAMQQQDDARRNRRTQRAEHIGKLVTRVICAILLVLFTLGALLTFPWSLPHLEDAWSRYLTTVMLIAFFLFTVSNIAWGSSIRTIGARLEIWLARQVHQWLTRISE